MDKPPGRPSDDARGRPVTDDDFVVLFNAHHDAVPFTLARYFGRRQPPPPPAP